MNIIEKVARALWADRYITDWSTIMSGSLEAQYKKHAKAMIEVMREPSEGMLAATNNLNSCYQNYQAMIDAALKEE